MTEQGRMPTEAEIKHCVEGGAGPCRNEHLIEELQAEVERLRREAAAAEAQLKAVQIAIARLLNRMGHVMTPLLAAHLSEPAAALRDAIAHIDHAALDVLLADERRAGAEAALRQAVARVQTYNKGEWQSVSRDDIVRLIRVSLPLEEPKGDDDG